MAKDINNSVFDDATKLKLDIFGECFEEWLPVFNSDFYTNAVYVFDFFAGSGKDSNNELGSPLVLLNRAKGKERKYCLKAKKEIIFLFNESVKEKSAELKQNIIQYIEKCKHENKCSSCIYKYTVQNYKFQDIFLNPGIVDILNDKTLGKFVLLDQYGFKEINEDVFKQLISFPKTDFIFFISSSFINRLREHPNITKYIDTSKIPFDDIKPNEINRAIADYFRDLIPMGKEYYLHHFSIRKEKKGNYYGLIFGSNHTLGMEIFLKVCWKHDKYSGEANYNIDNNYEEGTLFHCPENNIKKNAVKDELKRLILLGKIKDNITGLKLAMEKGCEPKVFVEVIKELEKENRISFIGKKNYSSTNIHRVKQYMIKGEGYDT